MTPPTLEGLYPRPARCASQIEEARRYIAEQEQHHRKRSFQDEFRLLLKRYELACGERRCGIDWRERNERCNRFQG